MTFALSCRALQGHDQTLGHFVYIQFSQNSWKRLARLEQHSRNGHWTRNRSCSWMSWYVRVADTLVVSPFEVPGRVPGLPIRDCARGCNNCVHTRAQMSAIHVTSKTIFERLYLVLGLRNLALCVSCPCAPTTPTIHCTTISRFLYNFFPRMAPHFFCP